MHEILLLFLGKYLPGYAEQATETSITDHLDHLRIIYVVRMENFSKKLTFLTP